MYVSKDFQLEYFFEQDLMCDLNVHFIFVFEKMHYLVNFLGVGRCMFELWQTPDALKPKEYAYLYFNPPHITLYSVYMSIAFWKYFFPLIFNCIFATLPDTVLLWHVNFPAWDE